jgi:protein-disulfide isomerase
MKFFHSWLVILLAGSAAAQTVPAAPSCSDTVAVVNGENLTATQLEQSQSKLLQARYKYYEAERKALDDFVDQKLLEMEAHRRNLTTQQLLQQEVLSHVKDPTEDQLQVYYEGLGTDQPYEAVRQKVLDSIREIRTNKYRAAYVLTLREQADIRILLAPPQTQVAVNDDPLLGSADAPVLLVEFADYECPYCQRVHADVKRLQAEYGGRLAVVYKDFPLPMHAHAQKAAEAARCAGLQNRYWDYHDQLFTNKQLEVPQLKDLARTLKLDGASFDQCLDSGAQAAVVEKDKAQGLALGLTGTPSFFVNGHFFSGAVDYYTLRASVEQQLTHSSSAVSQNTGNSSRNAPLASGQR